MFSLVAEQALIAEAAMARRPRRTQLQPSGGP